MCIQGSCQLSCKSNSSCPSRQFCNNNICIQELECSIDADCSYTQKCLTNNLGQTECTQACEGVLCGRNAECISMNHKAVCKCKSGYLGNPSNDDRLGCYESECSSSDQCSPEKLCDRHTCKIACLVRNPCGRHALCSTENHQQVCHCQPGFTGNPFSGCTLIDFCADVPCGPEAICVNSRGSFKCQCSSNMIGDPYNEGCHLPNECNADTDCPVVASCQKENNVFKCKDTCVEKDCGPNAECVAVDHEGHCTCRNGYERNPEEVSFSCRSKPVSCRSTSDCPSNTYCYGETCRRKY